MSSKSETGFRPDYAVPPGETLKETLESLGMTQAQLADRTGRPKKTINEIIKGKAAITAETSLQLERVLGIPAAFWNNLERNYQETLARLREEDKLRSQVEWLKTFPVNALIKAGWIKKAASPVQQLQELLNFFGVAGVAEWSKQWESPQAVYRKSLAHAGNAHAIAAWLRKGDIEASKMTCQTFDAAAFQKSLEQIRRLTMEPPEKFQPRLKEACAAAGVAMIFVPELPKTNIFGATRWLTPNKALIQLSLRGKSDDHLWFTIFHEAGHILLHGKKAIFINMGEDGCADGSLKNREELEANRFASDFLIRPKPYKEFVGRAIFDDSSIKSFANEQGIASGIVVGRLQHDMVIPYSRGNSLKKRLSFDRQ
jgi:HTH-type transcriptional regulator/antitoxin HigA